MSVVRDWLSGALATLAREPRWRLAEHATVALALALAARALAGGRGVRANLASLVLRAVKAAPGGAALVAREQAAVVAQIEAQMADAERELAAGPLGALHALPPHGLAHDALLELLAQWRACERGFRAGKQFGGIYSDDAALKRVMNETMALFNDSNGLYPTIFPALRRMECEVLRMTAALLHGVPDQTCGAMTTGGTESICLSVRSHKLWARATRGVVEPEAIVPVSAHAAFAKGCDYFDVKLVTAPVDENGRVIVSEVRKLMNSNTVLLVGSAPTFPQSVIDPIEELAALAKEHGCGMHVDACLGGYILPFFAKLGYVKEKFDFTLEGVTAMSADLHKFGFGPKQSSVILYRTRELRKYQFYAYSDWTGGIYASPSLTGSRSGGTIAASWATLVSLGEEGYLEKAKIMHGTLQRMISGINSIPDLYVIGPPQACGVAFNVKSDSPLASDSKAIFKVADAMGERGWFFPRLQNPISCMMQVAARSNFDDELFVSDLRECVEDVKNHPENFKEGMAKIYGMAADVPERSVVTDLLKSYLDVVYSP